MDTTLDLDGGWKEAVTIVSDLERWYSLADKVCGWNLAHRGPVDPRILSQWNLPTTATGEEALFCCGEEAQGFVRFMQLAGAGVSTRIRAGAMPWDTGGIFSLMVRTMDINGTYEAALSEGWTAVADPVSFQYNGLTLANVILRGPDGVSFGMYERVEPKLEGWDHIVRMSQPFNCMQIVRDRDATRDFHRDAFGFSAFVDNESRHSEPQTSNFGIPRNITTQYETRVAIMHPRGVLDAKVRDNGRVELIEWNGLEGRDLADRAVPPNLGHIGLRWAVSDVEQTAQRIRDAGYELASDIAVVSLKPYGDVHLCGVRTPDGVLYEFFETTS